MTREIIMNLDLYPNGVRTNMPVCKCGTKMVDDGGCRDGCCDDFKCLKCGKRIRVECGD